LKPGLFTPNGIDAWRIIALFTFTHGWHPEAINAVVLGGWSIGVELTFCLLLPLGFLAITTLRRAMLLLLASVVLGALLSIFVFLQSGSTYPEEQKYILQWFSYFWFPSQAPVFALGIVGYFLATNVSFRRSDRKPIRNGPLICAVILLCGMVYLLPPAIFDSHVIFSTALLFLMLCLLENPSKLFVNSVTVAIGKVSFSLYLCHVAVMEFLRSAGFLESVGNADLRYISSLLVSALLALGVSVITYWFMELPGIAVGRRLIEWRESRLKIQRLRAERVG
jgi:peptidoglycan/LPS O-acetylase OafA/YrhL